jgi:hypothetical protein
MRLVFLLLLAVPAFGQSEICRFRAGDADNPFKRWLTSPELTCVAASAATPVPAGLWNVFARGAGGLSAPVLVKGGASQEALPLGPAATLRVQLPEGRGGVVYSPRRAIAFPLTDASMPVPAGEELWLLVLDKARAVESIVPIAAIAEKTERSVDARTGALPPSVLGWLQVAAADRETLRTASGAASPQVRLTATGPALDSDPLPPLTALHGAFALVRGVSAGDAELAVGGRGWLAHKTHVKIDTRAVTAVRAPLLVRPSASLIVNWFSAENMLELDRSLGSCDPSKDKPPRFEISISACPKPKHPGDPVDPASCQLLRQETYGPQVPSGSFAVDDLVPGTYRVEMRFGKLPAVGVTGTAVALQQKPVHLQAYYMSLYGSLTRGGQPLERDATLHFPSGGVGFGSHETGEYVAVVPYPIIEPDEKIDIAECDGGLRQYVLADDYGKQYARFDLDIPDNRLQVGVGDTFTRMALHDATLRYTVMSKLVPYKPVLTRTVKADDDSRAADGRVVVRSVPEREIHLLVTHAGYQPHTVEPFTMPKSGTKTIDVQLVPLRGSGGRILSARPFEDAMVVWLSPAGVETEHADVAPDGTFIYANSHEPGETMAVASLSHPLWVFRAPAVANRQMLEVHFPDAAPVREFSVAIEGAANGPATYIGIVIGGVLVPQSALRVHQTLRELEWIVRVGGSLTFPGIAETGPIEVLRGPTVNEVPSRGRSFDPLMLPRAEAAPRKKLLPGVAEVVFE